MSQTILAKIARKGSDKAKIAAEVIRKPRLVSVLFEGLRSERAAVKFGCAKVLQLLSETKPELIYPHFDVFVAMLDDENSILKWGAIITIANLTVADSENKFEKNFYRFFASIPGPQMITAGNTVRCAPKIIDSKPHLAGRICAEILKVERAEYQTRECVNIACGHAIDAFSEIFDKIDDKQPVLSFVNRQLKNTRPAVRKRAEKFVKRHGRS